MQETGTGLRVARLNIRERIMLESRVSALLSGGFSSSDKLQSQSSPRCHRCVMNWMPSLVGAKRMPDNTFAPVCLGFSWMLVLKEQTLDRLLEHVLPGCPGCSVN